MAYLKPQSPIKNGDDHVYPLTTIDQVIKGDGKRLGLSDGTINITSSDISTGGSEGQILAVNADGTISPNSRTIASLGTGATYSLDGTTLTITTL